MSVSYGFFNAINSDRVYNADQMSMYFQGLVSDGVYESVDDAMQVVAGSGMSVNVKKGRAIINCKWISLNAIEPVAIAAADSTHPRYTAVVVRLDVANRLMEIGTVNGTAAASPSYPTLTNTDLIKEICLAMVYVAAGATSISQGNITDMRASSSCGWVTGLIEQVDTSELFLQWQTAYQDYYDEMTAGFNAWFESLTNQLNVNTYVAHFEKHVTLNGSATSVVLDMTDYVYDESDIINVYINGLYAAKTVDYTLTVSSGNASITGLPAVNGTVVDIQVLKSKIGFYAVAASSSEMVGINSNVGVIA